MKYPHLFTPIKINNMIVPNRIVAAPMGQEFFDKSLGGAGIVIAGSIVAEPGFSSWFSPEEPYAFHKYEVEKTRQRLRVAKQAGAKAAIELGHAGQYARVKDYAKGPVGFIREDGVEVKAMDEAMMEETLQWYERIAADVKDLGFDILFMHFGHGWLAAEFLSPLFNHRTDEYGGSLENRARFPLRILERVRKAVGPDFPIDMRISAIEWVPGSIEFEDTLAFIRMAEPYIDTVQISCGLDINHEGNVHTATTNFEEHMPNAAYARRVKEQVSIPVSVVGAVMDPDMAEELIAGGSADMVALGRPLAADPYWPKKAREDRPEDIVPCLRCLQCYHIATNRRNVGCSVNPRYGNESWISGNPGRAQQQKKVIVIGAGPAGVKAALTASGRGHEVILYEKEDHIGGALHYIAKEYYKKDIRRYLTYLKTQLDKSAVQVRLGTAADPALIRQEDPATLIVAVGSEPATPPIRGADQPHVIGFYDAIAAEADGAAQIGERVVVIGGGTIGAEIALELAARHGKEVTIIELTDKLAAQGNMLYRIGLRQHMEREEKLHVMLDTACQEIRADDVLVRTGAGIETAVAADTVIIAVGVRPKQEEAQSFYGITTETYMIGDCDRPGKIMDATFFGYTIAANI